MESNFKNNNENYNKFNNGGYNKFNNFQPQAAAAQPVAEVEPKDSLVKAATRKVTNSVNNLPMPAKAGLLAVGIVGTIWAVDKFALNGRIKNSVLGVFGFGKNDSKEEDDGFEETK